MKKSLQVLFVSIALFAAFPGALRACGFVEAPLPCGEDNAEHEAKWMLGRAAAKIDRDEAQALRAIGLGEPGLRTAGASVCCLEPDRMVAGDASVDTQEPRDSADDSVCATTENAGTGRPSQMRTRFFLSRIPQAPSATAFCTRAHDQVCGIGAFEDEHRTPPPGTPEKRASELRARLDNEMPATLRSAWSAYLDALNVELGARDAILAKVRREIHAIETTVPNATSPIKE